VKPAAQRLAGYTDVDGTTCEIVRVTTSDSRRLIIDRATQARRDALLVGELGAEEPDDNAQLLADLYVADVTRGRCRPLQPQDLAPEPAEPSADLPTRAGADTAVDAAGVRYALLALPGELTTVPELRWVRLPVSTAHADPPVPITLRDLVGHAESYEPARSITTAALARHQTDPDISTARLAAELKRLLTSTIVLNRGVREAVRRDVATGELTLSAIAQRCGRLKRDHRGNSSGETSWLARRIGEMPEGNGNLTPWIHSNTLALIARDGLGRDPHEVEVE
jgi:hypothetical protein